ncbi:uncharacterized protein LOC107992041 [Cucumis melo]|uniref:Uncharacterized protein LOC107992041 n=1 Tax=Cucumis melo TaxID=3656 RepID=A0A1S4E4G0_CUCME|nr:uncharacterized protein LOC107992041 [Cucumis melo]
MKAKRVQLQGLRTEFETLRMKTSESVIDFFAKTMTIANKMQIHGEKMEDVAIMENILRSMTSKFNFVEIEDEEDDDLKAEEATIVAANKDTINTKRINFKEEEKEEERKEETITQQLTSQQKNHILNATDAINMAIINQNVEQI